MQLGKFLLFGASMMVAGLLSAQTTQRIPLYETYTSSTCPPCKPGNEHLEELFAQPENEGKFTSIKYQMSWPGAGDPYYTTEAGARRGFYGINSVPRLELDGGFDENPTGLTQEMMDDAYETPAVVEIEAFYQVDEATQTVDIQVSVKALAELESSGGLFLHVAIFEHLTTGNVKSNGETEFINVMKKMVPSSTGSYVGGMDPDEVKEFDLSYTFNGDYILPPDADSPVDHSENHTVEEFSDLGVVVWVQRSATREVYQSAYALNGTAGIDEVSNDPIKRLSVYPNPANEITRIIYSTRETSGDVTISIMDNAGKLVFEQVFQQNPGVENVIFELDTKDYDNGIYFVTLSTKEGRKTEKLSIIH